jgi:hypothetical protein
MEGDLLADGVGIIAAIGQQCFGLVGNHPEQRAEALHIVSFAGRQDETERAALSITGGVELCRETASRSTKRLGRLSPFFMPTAQWCARTTALSIISADLSRPAISAKVSSMASNTPVSTQRR